MRRIIFVNVSKSSDPERLSNICVANVSDKAAVFLNMEVFMNDREFSDIEIYQHSGKGIPLFITGHKIWKVNLFGPGPRLICIKKKRIYRAAVSQRLRNAGLDDGMECLRLQSR